MKLYRATVEVEVLIAAEEEPDDREIQRHAAKRLNANGGITMLVEEIVSRSQVDALWMRSVPYGNTKLTVDQLLRRIERTEDERKWHTPMPNQKPLPIE